jgi:hypothetical protein
MRVALAAELGAIVWASLPGLSKRTGQSNAEGYVNQLDKREHVALETLALSRSRGPQNDLIGQIFAQL